MPCPRVSARSLAPWVAKLSETSCALPQTGGVAMSGEDGGDSVGFAGAAGIDIAPALECE